MKCAFKGGSYLVKCSKFFCSEKLQLPLSMSLFFKSPINRRGACKNENASDDQANLQLFS